jgi:hypothetical protein
MKLKFILSAFVLVVSTTVASSIPSHREEGLRYPAPHEVYKILQEKFPLDRSLVSTQCQYNNNKGYVTGDSDPATGKPRSPTPNSIFLAWYSNCLFEYIRADFGAAMNSEIDFSRYMPSDVVDFAKQFIPGHLEEPTTERETYFLLWSDLSDELKRSIVENLLDNLVGPPNIFLGLAESLKVPEAERANFRENILNNTLAALPALLATPEVKSEGFKKFIGINGPINPRNDKGEITVYQAIKILTYLICIQEGILLS